VGRFRPPFTGKARILQAWGRMGIADGVPGAPRTGIPTMSQQPGQIPLEPDGAPKPESGYAGASSLAGEAEKKPRLEARPILELAEDECPNCHAQLEPDAVVCLKCGYDLKANVVRTPETGVDVKAAPEEPVLFVTPGGPSPRVLTAIGGVLTMGAMVAAAAYMPPHTFWHTAAQVALALYETALHTGTGVVAVLVAARICEQRIGRVDLAATRIFVAFAAFQLVHRLYIFDYVAWRALVWVLAGAAYWGLVMLLFRKDRITGLLIVLAHFVLWALVELGMALSAWVGSGHAGAGVPGAGGS
jgi:hypothetical protein